MSSPQQIYRELLALTQLVLTQDNDRSDSLYSDSATYAYFKKLATKTRKEPPPVATKEPSLAPQSKPSLAAPRPKPQPAASVVKKEIAEKVVKEDQAAIKEPEPVITTFEKKRFQLDPMATPPSMDLCDVRKIVSTVAPEIKILDTPGQGELKLKMSPISLIVHRNGAAEDSAFLNNVAKAIEERFLPVKIYSLDQFHNDLEKLLKQHQVKLLLIEDKLYQGLSENIKRLLKMPKCFLLEIGLYSSNPTFKADLWKQIRNFLQNPS